MRTRLHPAASAEADAAALWYEGERPGLGHDFLAELNRAVAAISEAPRTWPFVRGSRTYRLFVLPRFPYKLLYRIARDEIRIHAVAHTSRRPGFWRGRRFR